MAIAREQDMAVGSQRSATVIVAAPELSAMSLVWCCCSSMMPAETSARLARGAENAPDGWLLFTGHGTTTKDVGWGIIAEVGGG